MMMYRDVICQYYDKLNESTIVTNVCGWCNFINLVCNELKKETIILNKIYTSKIDGFTAKKNIMLDIMDGRFC